MTLSPAEQEKLNEFQIITNFPEDDYDKVVKLFQNNYWNLEIALSKFFDGQLDQEVAREAAQDEPIQPSPPSPIQPPQFENNLNNLGLNEQQVWTQDVLQQPLLDTMLVPKLPLVKPISTKWKSAGLQQLNSANTTAASSHFGNFFESPLIFIILLLPRTITLILSYIGSFFSFFFPEPVDSIPDVPTLPYYDFDESFKQLTHDKNTIDYYKGEFNDAFNDSKADFKFLILVLLSNNETSDIFVKKVLNNERVTSLLNNKEDYITYITNVHEAQGLEIAKSLKIKFAPSVYLIGNVANGPSLVSSMSIISKIPLKSANSFIGRMQLETTKYKPEFISKKFEKAELDYSRQLKQAQDKAYEESLQQDRLKEMEKQEKIKEKEQQEKQLQFQQENRLRLLNNTRKKFQDLSHPNYVFAKGQFINVRFQLPSGPRITQKFPSNFTTHDIYAFIELQLHLQQNPELELTDDEIHQDYKHEYDFELISPIPRFTVPVGDDKQEVKEVKELWPNASLLIEFKGEEDDDED